MCWGVVKHSLIPCIGCRGCVCQAEGTGGRRTNVVAIRRSFQRTNYIVSRGRSQRTVLVDGAFEQAIRLPAEGTLNNQVFPVDGAFDKPKYFVRDESVASVASEERDVAQR